MSRAWVRVGWLLPCLVAVMLSIPAPAAEEPQAIFEGAARLFEQGQFRAAADTYERIVQTGRSSPAVHFNAGNAWLKAGDPGRAIWHYRLAERLVPRDRDLAANLRFAREQVAGGSLPRAPWWQRLLRRISVDEWALVAGVLGWIALGSLTAAELRASWRSRGRRWGALAGSAGLLAAVSLFVVWQDQYGRTVAIVTAPEAVVRYGPLDVSPPLQTAPAGSELTVLDRTAGWFQVEGLARGAGWIPATNVMILPGR